MDTVPQKDYKQPYEQVQKETQELKVELQKMQLQMKKFQQMLFGSKWSRFLDNPTQLLLELNTAEAYTSSSMGDAKESYFCKSE